MAGLSIFIKQFSSLNRAPGSTWNVATNRKAPHKPILLLAVLDLVHRGVISTPFIDVTGDMVELNELFNLYWRRIALLGQTTSIAFPFSRMDREPFWNLVPVPNAAITSSVINNTSSVSYLRKYALGARMDDDLFGLMATTDGREALKETLLRSCFSEQAQAALREQSGINTEAFDYSRLLEEKSHLPLVKEILETEIYRAPARDQGFRRIIVTTYDHRCALCGIRIVTPEGHTAVEAAHIVPWSDTQNDDIRNGMALCKLCHWAFDKGMLGVSSTYHVVTSKAIALVPNYAGPLQTLHGRGIIPPKEETHRPAQHFLAVHRSRWRLH